MCLICKAYVYRINQNTPSEADKDAPNVAPEGWIEQEVMRSLSGWIEVQKECLTGGSIHRAESTSDYSSLFSVVLPSPTTLPPSPKAAAQHLTPITTPSPQLPKEHLPERSPLFPPPPFAHPHPVFTHLSAVASTQVNKLRAEAEESIAEFIRNKVAELDHAESVLREQVGCLWKTYQIGSSELRQVADAPPTPVRHNSGKETSTHPQASTTIRDFVPSPVPPTRPMSATATKRISSLSASLVTSTFHHPRALEDNKNESILQSVVSNPPPASIFVASLQAVNGSNVLQFPRNTNDDINTAASYRFFLNLEEEMARKKQRQERTKNESKPLQLAPAVAARNKPSADLGGEAGKGVTDETHGQDKGKRKERKVTFDVQPAVVTIKTDVKAESEEEWARSRSGKDNDSGFGFGGVETCLAADRAASTIPIQPTSYGTSSQPSSRWSTQGVRWAETRVATCTIKCSSPIKKLPSGRRFFVVSGCHAFATPRVSKPKAAPPPPEEPPTPREAEILSLLAADMPSHRGAWRRDGKAWKSFVNRMHANDKVDDIPEEDEDYVEDSGMNGCSDPFIGSMPVAIKHARPAKQVLSLASYQPTAAIHSRRQIEATIRTNLTNVTPLAQKVEPGN
ncbi:SET domain-containing protein [Salix suchowensis]|nr:SET domain-containing protein [Salix suchowensis]